MYRLLIETLLGLNLEGNQLRLTPRLPPTWTTFKMHYRYHQTHYHLSVSRVAVNLPCADELILDGQLVAGHTLHLVDDCSDHSVEIMVR